MASLADTLLLTIGPPPLHDSTPNCQQMGAGGGSAAPAAPAPTLAALSLKGARSSERQMMASGCPGPQADGLFFLPEPKERTVAHPHPQDLRHGFVKEMSTL